VVKKEKVIVVVNVIELVVPIDQSIDVLVVGTNWKKKKQKG
jgi:hypothetical protein